MRFKAPVKHVFRDGDVSWCANGGVYFVSDGLHPDFRPSAEAEERTVATRRRFTRSYYETASTHET